MRTLLIVVLVLPVLVCNGCDQSSVAASSAAAPSPVSHEYEIKIEGTAGVQLDMLLVWKPSQDNPKRVSERIIVPYSKQFAGTGGWVWFDSLPDGASGKPGDIYTIDWLVNGNVRGTVEGIVKPGKQSSGLGRW